MLISKLFGGFPFLKKTPVNLFIHVGPGKTGSSVIQNWSVQNQDFLAKSRFFYPNHGFDSNGISSGHANKLCSRELVSLNDQVKYSPPYFDSAKSKLFLKVIQSLKYPNILLSSEAFWMQLDSLCQFFPQAKFIFYIRSPMSFLESGYNQRVKRQNIFTEIKETLPNYKVQCYGAKMLLDMVAKYGRERFIIKLYNRKRFKEGNVLYDFYSIFGLTKLPNVEHKEINTSYSFEALEFKRFLNQFEISRQFNIKLDQLLQRYPDGDYQYSLLPPEFFHITKKKEVEYMQALLQELQFNAVEIEEYLEDLNATPQKNYRTQSELAKDSELMWDYIQKDDASLCQYLKQIVKK